MKRIAFCLLVIAGLATGRRFRFRAVLSGQSGGSCATGASARRNSGFAAVPARYPATPRDFGDRHHRTPHRGTSAHKISPIRHSWFKTPAVILTAGVFYARPSRARRFSVARPGLTPHET